MAKVGLKETLALLAAGYKKKEIEALAEIDLEEVQPEQPAAQTEDKKDPDPATGQAQSKDPDPDYKQLYEDLLKKNQETEAKVTKLQQDNVHEDSGPSAEIARQKESEALETLVRSFM